MIERRGFLGIAALGTVAGLSMARTSAHSAENTQAAAASAPASAPYQAPGQVRELTPAMLVDLEKEAEKVLEPGPFAYIARGVEKQWTIRENTRAFDDYQFSPRYLANQPAVDLTTSLLGHTLNLPIITTPMGAQGLAHQSAELGTARGTHMAGTLMGVSTAANTTIEDIAAASPGPKWFQIYLLENDQAGSRKLLQRAKAAGYSAIIFTIDAFAPGGSDDAERLSFSFPSNLKIANTGTPFFKKSLSWDDVAFIRDSVDLPLILKGPITPDLVDKALSYGVSAIQVSNHGGRMLDSAPAAITALPGIVKAVNGKVPVIMDSGIRRGSDVLKALALGAQAVALGRPVLYGLALGGDKGVASVYQRLSRELSRAMTLAGVSSIKDIDRGLIIE